MENGTKVWGIHTPEINDNLFLGEGVIALGWKEMGDLSILPANRDDFYKKFSEIHTDAATMSVKVSAGILYRFVHELKVGDYIVFPSKSDRMINMGKVEGDYYYDGKAVDFVQRRKVTWLKHLPRIAFSQGALYEVGSLLSFFTIKNYADEFLSSLNQGFENKSTQEDESVAVTAEEIKENTKDFILKELYRQLKGYDLESFVADLLKAMGYHTKISPHGGDRGVDIVAYKDELPPRILVQVKSTDGDIQESTIQSLKGTLHEGDYGLFVTLSNYMPNAMRYLAENPIIKGINGAELVDLVIKYYDQLDERYQRMIPLEKVYIPVKDDTEEAIEQ